MSYLKKAQEFQHMMDNVGVMEAFEKYYHDDCQITEMPTGEVRNGKSAQRDAIQGWFGMVKEFHGSGVDSITADEDNGVTMIESWTDVTFHEGGRIQMKEVGVQRWQDDQIIDEKFYYQMGPPPQMG